MGSELKATHLFYIMEKFMEFADVNVEYWLNQSFLSFSNRLYVEYDITYRNELKVLCLLDYRDRRYGINYTPDLCSIKFHKKLTSKKLLPYLYILIGNGINSIPGCGFVIFVNKELSNLYGLELISLYMDSILSKKEKQIRESLDRYNYIFYEEEWFNFLRFLRGYGLEKKTLEPVDISTTNSYVYELNYRRRNYGSLYMTDIDVIIHSKNMLSDNEVTLLEFKTGDINGSHIIKESQDRLYETLCGILDCSGYKIWHNDSLDKFIMLNDYKNKLACKREFTGRTFLKFLEEE